MKHYHFPIIPSSGMPILETRILESLKSIAHSRHLWTWKPWSTYPGVAEDLEKHGIFHQPEDLKSHSTIVIPPHGAPMSLKKIWKSERRNVIDHSSAAVRRAQSAFALMRLEGSALAIVGRRSDPETLAIIADHPRALVIENAEDAVRIPFHPSYSLICQTAFDPALARKFSEIIQGRHRDSKVTFLDTSAPEEEIRRRELRNAAAQLESVIVRGYSLAAEMLCHTAREMRLNVYHNILPPFAVNRCAIIASSDVPQSEFHRFPLAKEAPSDQAQISA